MSFVHADPFQFLSLRVQTRAIVYTGLLGLAAWLVLVDLGQTLITPAAPMGMVSLEFARYTDDATRIVGSWNQSARIDAALAVGFDYVFIACYATFLSLLCIRIARKLYGRHPWPAFVGALLSWAMLVAGLADGVENYALMHVLRGSGAFLWPWLAFWSAAAKFTIIGVAVAYCVWGWLFYLNSAALHQFRASSGAQDAIPGQPDG